jgi:hypothetical protein
MFSFFTVFFHKLFLIEKRKEEQERQMLEMLHVQALQAELAIFSRSKQTMTGRMDRWMTGQIAEMMLHIPTSFTVCNSVIE